MNASDAGKPNPNSPTAKMIQEMVALGLSQKTISESSKVPEARVSRWARGIGTESSDDTLRLRSLLNSARMRAARLRKEEAKA